MFQKQPRNIGDLMPEQLPMAPARVFWWSAAVWLAPVLALAAVAFPLMVIPAVVCLVLGLTFGFSTYKAMLRDPGSRSTTRWWLGATALSLVAQLVNLIVLATPPPRYADYFPPEEISPIRHMIVYNADPLHWAATGTAVFAAIAGVVLFRVLMSHLRTVQRDPAVRQVS